MNDTPWPWEGEYVAQFLQDHHVRGVLDDLALGSSDVVLDAGCGNGILACALAEKCHLGIVIACDTDDTAVRATLNRSSEVSNLFVLKSAVDFVRLAPHACDRIICRNVLHLLEDPVMTLRHLSTLLRRNGLLLLEFPAARNLDERMFLESVSRQWDESRRRSYYLPEDIQSMLSAIGYKAVRRTDRLISRLFPVAFQGSGASCVPYCRMATDGGIAFEMVFTRLLSRIS